MAITALDIIDSALSKIGVLATGETAEAGDAIKSLAVLNDIVDQWSLEDLMITNAIVTSYPLVAGINTISIGPTGDIVVPDAPIEVLNAYIRDVNQIDTVVTVVSFEQYQMVTQKTTSGTYPTILGYQNSHPNANIYLWPTPFQNLELRLVYNIQFTQFANLASVVDLATGYKKALIDCLAQELCIYFGRPEMMDAITQVAVMSKMNIKRKNVKTTQMSIDPGFITQKMRTYNPYSDT